MLSFGNTYLRVEGNTDSTGPAVVVVVATAAVGAGLGVLLAFVLGPILERAIRQALLISAGSPLIFFTRPISGALMGFLILWRRDAGAATTL